MFYSLYFDCQSWVYLNLVHVNNAWLHHLLVSILNSWLHILLPLLLSRIHDLLVICTCLSHIWIERQGDSLVDLRHPSNWRINLLPGYYSSRWSIYPDWKRDNFSFSILAGSIVLYETFQSVGNLDLCSLHRGGKGL